MTNINSNYRLLAAQANQETEKVTSGTNGKSLSDMAAEIKSSYQESEDDVTREIEDAADDVSDWTKAEQILSATFSGLSQVATAMKDLFKDSGTSSTGATTTESPSKSLDDAIAAFEADPSGKRADLISAIGSANETVEALTTQNAELEKGNYDSIYKDLETQADEVVENKKTADSNLETANNKVTQATDAMATIQSALAGNEESKQKVTNEQDGVIKVQINLETTIKVKKSAQAETEQSITNLVNEYESRIAAREGIDDRIAMANDDENYLTKEAYTDNDGVYHEAVYDTAQQQADKAAAEEEKRLNEEAIAKLEGQIEFDGKTLTQLKADVTTAEEGVANAVAQIAELAQQIQGYVDMAATLDDKYATANDTKNEAQAAAENNENLVKAMSEAEGDYKDLKVDADKAKENANAKIKENNNAIKAWNKSIDKAQKALDKNPVDVTEGTSSVKVGNTTYDVKDGAYGYYVNDKGEKVDAGTEGATFKKIGKANIKKPAATQS